MDLIAIEFPTPRMTIRGQRQAFKFLRITLGVGKPGKFLQVFANQLVQTRSQNLGPLSRARYYLIVHRKSQVHTHIIRAHGYCVNRTSARQGIDGLILLCVASLTPAVVLLLLRRALIATFRDGGIGYAKAAAYSALLSFFPVLASAATILVQTRAELVAKMMQNTLS